MKALLIAGGGTLGEYTKKELLQRGYEVDIICLEDKVSDNERVKYIKANVDYDYLEAFLEDKNYDGIVNFLIYTDVEEYKKAHMLLTSNTKHLIFLSSYRVYNDLQHPITESAPQLYDTLDDKEFLERDDYAVPKSKCEHFMREESGTKNWTIVRPVISFSERRFDIVTENSNVIERIDKGEEIILPLDTKNLTAGVDWAGNSGKLIANLLNNEKAYGEDFTVSSAQNLTWGEVADIYTELLGAKFKWVSTEEYLNVRTDLKNYPYIFKYDRLFDRKIDNSKILAVTGLKKEDFTPIKEGVQIEINNKRRNRK